MTFPMTYYFKSNHSNFTGIGSSNCLGGKEVQEECECFSLLVFNVFLPAMGPLSSMQLKVIIGL